MTRFEAENKLKEQFGLNSFFDEQWDAISKVMNGERILMIQKTGFGKSLCYQFPATQFEGLTIIFSPLIALMRDQIKNLLSRGIEAAAINSEEPPEVNEETLRRAVRGELSMLYIAPERLGNTKWLETITEMKSNVSMIVVDEAHCISVWGHDFRPDYRRIINLVRSLPNNVPILATTATATKRTEKEILRQIGDRMTVIRGDLMRENFELYVSKVKSEDEKLKWLAQHIPQMGGTGIIYTGTRVNTKIYSKWLEHLGISSIDYNAGLNADQRVEIERGLMENRWKVIVSTNALGMGMDKPDIRFIIHTQIPQSTIHYYQEIGRAGRDGEKTKVVLLYNNNIDESGIEEDLKLPLSFIENARPKISEYNKVIHAIKESPLRESDIMRETNLRQQQVRVIKADLLDQRIARETKDNRTTYLEYRFGAPEVNEEPFRILREHKKGELDSIKDYIYNSGSRMKLLCSYLGDEHIEKVENCDNTNLSSLNYSLSNNIEDQLNTFWDNFFPVLTMAPKTSMNSGEYILLSPFWKQFELRIKQSSVGTANDPNKFISLIHEEQRDKFEKYVVAKHLSKPKITDVITSSYYSYPKVGLAIRKSKYQHGGDFPDFLIERMHRAYNKHLEGLDIDIILFVPPTESGLLVENLAKKLGATLGLPVLNIIQKIKNTKPQKMFENRYLKLDNVKEAFGLIQPELISNKKALLIDDVIDSGATIKEVAKLLHNHGASLIAPIVIAKTVGGDQL